MVWVQMGGTCLARVAWRAGALGALAVLLGFSDAAVAAGNCALGTDPDADSVCTAIDNCPLWPNSAQTDSNGDGIGDACLCGDVDANNQFDAADIAVITRYIAGLSPGPASDLPLLCDVFGNGDCSGDEAIELRKILAGLVGPAVLCADFRVIREHALGRIGYGGDDWSRDRTEQLGLIGYIQEQLDPSSIPDDEFETQLDAYRSGTLATLGKSIPVLESQFCDTGDSRCTDRREGPDVVVAQLAEIKLLRAIYSRRQLEAVLLDFWFNLFNVDGVSEFARWSTPEYEEQNIRPHVLGRFEDLAQGMTQGLAMLDYLDLRRSTATNANENFARELMELHTAGKEGTYDEADVQEVMRILTGYTYDGDRIFEYKSGRHDDGIKQVSFENTPPWIFDGTLGCDDRPAADFSNEGEILLCLLARHPKTAERVSRRLIERFVAEEAPQSLVDSATQVWLSTDGDIAAVMGAILLNTEFISTRHFRSKFKRPHHEVASLIRSVGKGTQGPSLILEEFNGSLRADSYRGLIRALDLMGERLYAAGPPTGYPEASAAWTTESGLLSRMNAATAVLEGLGDPSAHFGINGGSAVDMFQMLENRLLPSRFERSTVENLFLMLAALPGNTTTEVRIREAAIFLLSSPEFMLH